MYLHTLTHENLWVNHMFTSTYTHAHMYLHTLTKDAEAARAVCAGVCRKYSRLSEHDGFDCVFRISGNTCFCEDIGSICCDGAGDCRQKFTMVSSPFDCLHRKKVDF